MKNFKAKICYVANIDMAVKFLLLNQLNFLKNNDYDIYTVCSAGNLVKDIEKKGIKVKTIRFKRKISPISDLITLFRLYFYFKKEKFDIVHTHTPKPGLLGQLAAKMAGVPIIINTIHGFYFSENSSLLKRKFFVLIEKIAAKCSDLIFFISEENIKTATKKKICSSDLIKYLGRDIDMQRFDPKRFSEEFILARKKQFGISPNKKIIGIIARLVEEKGYLELFEAFKKVLEKFPNTVLLVVGPEEPEKKDAINPEVVKNYSIEKNVLFLGRKTDVDELYPLMDVFVLPTHREGIGATILEASAMEKPVIATRIGGCPEAINNKVTGILLPIKDSEKLAEAIIYLLKNPEKAKEMGRKGRRKVLREFDEKLIFDRIRIEYQRLIREKLKR